MVNSKREKIIMYRCSVCHLLSGSKTEADECCKNEE